MTRAEQSSNDALFRTDICGRSDNPNEFLVTDCRSCRQRGEGTRLHLQQIGWRLFVELLIEDHEGFPVCPQCSNMDYSREDLY